MVWCGDPNCQCWEDDEPEDDDYDDDWDDYEDEPCPSDCPLCAEEED